MGFRTVMAALALVFLTIPTLTARQSHTLSPVHATATAYIGTETTVKTSSGGPQSDGDLTASEPEGSEQRFSRCCRGSTGVSAGAADAVLDAPGASGEASFDLEQTTTRAWRAITIAIPPAPASEDTLAPAPEPTAPAPAPTPEATAAAAVPIAASTPTPATSTTATPSPATNATPTPARANPTPKSPPAGSTAPSSPTADTSPVSDERAATSTPATQPATALPEELPATATPAASEPSATPAPPAWTPAASPAPTPTTPPVREAPTGPPDRSVLYVYDAGGATDLATNITLALVSCILSAWGASLALQLASRALLSRRARAAGG